METNPKRTSQLARNNMIQGQLSPVGIQNQAILDAFRHLPREPFLSPQYESVAYTDAHLPIGQGEFSLAPRIIGLGLEALNLQPRDHLLQIGSGTGYISALASCLANRVFAIERHPDLLEKAKRLLPYFNIQNVHLRVGDAFHIQFEHLFDAIFMSGALPVVPDPFIALLKPGGRFFGIIDHGSLQQAYLIERTDNGYLKEKLLFETQLPNLHWTDTRSHFHF